MAQIRRLLEASLQKVDHDTLMVEASREGVGVAQTCLDISRRGLEKIEAISRSNTAGKLGETMSCDTELEVRGSESQDRVEGTSDV